MADEVRPAMTPEGWDLAAVPTGFIESLDRTEDGRIVNKCCGCAMPSAHAVAAFALHGQPFGFTREDVAALRKAIEIAGLADLRYVTPEWREHKTDYARLNNLAARISALLPPEAPTNG